MWLRSAVRLGYNRSETDSQGVTMASKPTIEELSKSLTTATPAQLKKLRAQVNGLLTVTGDTSPAPAQSDDWLLDGIVEELASRGLLHLGAAGTLKNTKAFKSYATRAPAIQALLLKGAPGLPQDRVVLRAFGRRVAACLADSLAKWTVVSPSLMLTSVDSAPGAVEESFPGYMECGLLGKLVRVSGSQTA